MRWRRYSVARTTEGEVITGATVQVFLAGTFTPVDVYEAPGSGLVVNQVSTDASGTYEYYVDAADYDPSARFKEVIISDTSSVTLDNIPIIRWDPTVGQSLTGEFTIQGSGNGITLPDGTRLTTVATPGAGITNTGDVSIAADTDADGAGEITLSTKGVARVRVPNGGGLQVDEGGTWKSLATTESVNNLPPLKNRLINGHFAVWQRGTSFTGITGIQYTADRWIIDANTYTPDVSRQNLAGYDIPGHIFRVSDAGITGVADSYLILSQRIEDVHTFAGQACTFNVWVYAAAAGELCLDLLQRFGAGGSTAVVVPGAVKSYSAGWTHIIHTFTVPSVASKTLGAGHCLQLNIWLAGGSDYDARTGWTGGYTPTDLSIDFVEAQLESGIGHTAYEYRPIGLEQTLCERYYRQPDYANGFAATANNIRFIGPLQPAMRAAPAVSLLTTSPTVLAPSSIVGSSSSVVGSVSSPTGWQAQIDGFSGLVVGNGAMLFTQNAIALDAEL